MHVSRYKIYNKIICLINAVSEHFTKKNYVLNINIFSYHLNTSKNKQISTIKNIFLTIYTVNNKKFFKTDCVKDIHIVSLLSLLNINKFSREKKHNYSPKKLSSVALRYNAN